MSKSLLIKKDKITKNLIVTKNTKIILSCGGLENSRILLWSKNKITKQFFAGVTYWKILDGTSVWRNCSISW